MARPTTRSADLTRTAIIAAAVDTFSQHGFSAVTTRTLAAAAGVNIGTLSYHFGNKQGVYDAAVEQVYAQIRAAAAELAPQLATMPRRDQVTAVVDYSRRERNAVRLLTREVLDNGRMSPATEQGHFLPNIAAHSALLAQVFDVPPARARALMVSGGFLLSRFAIQDDDSLCTALGLDDVSEVRDAVVDILLSLTTSMLGA